MAAKMAGNVAAKLKKLGASVDAHKGDQTRISIGGDPPPLEDGIAQLVECKIAEYGPEKKYKGELYLHMAGKILEPFSVSVDGRERKVRGLRTFKNIDLFDKKDDKGAIITHEDDQVDKALNELRLLGADTSDVTSEDLVQLCSSLKEDAPYFNFRIWKGQKQTTGPFKGMEPRTNHTWMGVAEGYVPSAEESSDDDGSPAADEEPADEPKAKASAKEKPKADKAGAKKKDLEGQKEIPFGDTIDDLVADAQSEDEDVAGPAQDQLTDAVLELGWTEQHVHDSKSWQQVGEWARSGKGPEDGEEESADETAEPEVGGVFGYHPTVFNPKTKKLVKSKNASDHEIVKVDTEKKTVHLKSVENDRPVLDPKSKKPLSVPWSELIAGEA